MLIISLLSIPLSASDAPGEEVHDGTRVVRDESAGISLRIPPPAGARFDRSGEFHGIFLIAEAPFGIYFTDPQTFVGFDITNPKTGLKFYTFSWFDSPEFRVVGDGSYDTPLEAALAELGITPGSLTALPREKRREIQGRYKEIENRITAGIRYTTDPAEMLVYLRRMAERYWSGPDVMDVARNGGEQLSYFLKDATVTTTRASLPDAAGGALATRLEFHIDSEEFLFGRRFVDLSENALYFVCGPKNLSRYQTRASFAPDDHATSLPLRTNVSHCLVADA